MTMIRDDDRLGFFLAQMATKTGTKDRLDHFMNAVIETGGEVFLRRDGSGRGSHLVELSLFGIHDAGATPEEALANWIARANDHVARKWTTWVAEHLVTGDLAGIPADKLRAAAERVRLYSQDLAAIDAARRVEAMIAEGHVA